MLVVSSFSTWNYSFKPASLFTWLTRFPQSEAPEGTLEAMARANAANINGGTLNEADKQGLSAMLARLEQYAASIRAQLSPATSGSSAAQDAEPASPAADTATVAEMNGAARHETDATPTAPVADPGATTPVTEAADERQTETPKTMPVATKAQPIGAPSTPPPDEKNETEAVVMAAVVMAATTTPEDNEAKAENGDVDMAD